MTAKGGGGGRGGEGGGGGAGTIQAMKQWGDGDAYRVKQIDANFNEDKCFLTLAKNR